MTNKEFLIEIQGIVKTISSYTNDPFIISYSEQLATFVIEEDEHTVLLLVKKLIAWYDKNINNITNDRFVNNKQYHEYSYQTLKNYQNLHDTK
ncbi:hypothetical protein CI105_07375 [Candidatus Izimaplasma bacterium ZiA1]|uniref:hypothetical protein n=1 Tax=Candidatus Izimoplasma sp. ZiA1 TaxID=2024899 RepID=UPI000BAA5D50|nr:hypothetical protein CI105_07375 [Candidatus Izimaplasma bacterium ZiA1]